MHVWKKHGMHDLYSVACQLFEFESPAVRTTLKLGVCLVGTFTSAVKSRSNRAVQRNGSCRLQTYVK
jgi:hypothetical protein